MTIEERRIVTILFSDIVGSTMIAEQQDPEEWREIIEQVHKLAGDIVLSHQGQVLQYLGDGILAIFGADHASERDPERAIRAALELINRVPDLPTNPHLEMRAGVHTGLVVLGELGGEAKRELTATGDAMNLAHRLQSFAQPSTVVISHDCYRYVRGLFNILKQKPVKVKGRQAQAQHYLVQSYKDRPFRMVSRGVGGVKTTTVGRVTEMAQLNQQLHEVIEDDRLIWSQIIAGPGLGKTRMLGDVIEALDLVAEEIYLLRTQALEGDTLRPFAAIRRLWFELFRITEDAQAAEVEKAWEHQVIGRLGPAYTVEAVALGLLIGLAFKHHPSKSLLRGQPGSVLPLAIKASQKLLRTMIDEKPLILLIEDLQWADLSSWKYLTSLFLDHEPELDKMERTLILATARPEWLPPPELLNSGNFHQMELTPLETGESEQLISQLLQHSEPLPSTLVDRIIQRSEGVPYFLEELVNWLIDTRAIDIHDDPWRFKPDNLDEDMLPQTLHHLLSTRLNNLGVEYRQILQAGAIFGRNFWEGGLEALGMEFLNEKLEGLEQRGFIQANGSSSFKRENEWTFHHNLMQEVAYESVLRRERPAHHHAAARWLEQRAREAERIGEFAGMLGRHYELAGESITAVDWYLQHDQRLGILAEVDSRQRALKRALSLAKDSDDLQRTGEVQFHLGSFYETLGEHQLVKKYALMAENCAKHLGNDRLLGLAQAMMVVCLTRLGQLEEAEEHALSALETLERVEDIEARARILTNLALFYTESGDLGMGAQLTQEQIKINQQTKEKFGETIGTSNLGYILLQLGRFKESRQALARAIRLAEDINARRMKAYGLLNLALAYWRSREPGEGQGIIQEQVFPEFEATQDRYGMGIANLYLGLCYESNNDHTSSTVAFGKALEFMRDINVPGPYMDALAGLVRCDLGQGEIDQACERNDELWSFLRKEGAGGLEFPIIAYQTCARAFEASDEPKNAQKARKEGHTVLRRRAEKISDEKWRQSYLENIPEHKEVAKSDFDIK